MKKYFSITVALFALAFSSCVKDIGNYNYIDESELIPSEIVGIGGLEKLTGTCLEPFTLKIEIKGLKPEDEDKYEYYWSSYPLGGSVRDTICRTKDCYVEKLMLKPGMHYLTFEIKNKKNGAFKRIEGQIEVSSNLANGWFVLKDENNVTDVYLRNLNGKVYPDLFKTINGEGIPGQARHFSYMADRYCHLITNPDGTKTPLTGLKAFFVTTSEDIRAYNGSDMKFLKNFNDMFLVTPPTIVNPQSVTVGMSCIYVMNNNKMHYVSSTSNSGAAGMPMLGDYSLFPNFIAYGFTANSLVFDEVSSSFKAMIYSNTSLTTLSEVPELRSCNNMNCDVVHFNAQDGYYFMPTHGMAILKEKTSGEYYSMRLSMASVKSSKNPITDFMVVPADRKVLKAKLFGNNHVNNVVYFSAGDNQIGSYNLINQIEKTILTLPADEKISCVRHLNIGYQGATLSRLAVLANKDNKWKLYTFDFEGQTAEILIPETLTPLLEGSGNAKYVSYADVGTAAGIN